MVGVIWQNLFLYGISASCGLPHVRDAHMMYTRRKALTITTAKVIIMDTPGVGADMAAIKNEIAQLKAELDGLGSGPDDVPELIESANLLRKNQYLKHTDAIRAQLVTHYGTYTKNLESLLASVFEIQKDLKDILREQNRLIPSTSKRKTLRRKK